MPEAAVHFYDSPMPRQDNIGPTRQTADIQSKSEPEAMQD